MIVVDKDKCVGCGLCAKICHEDCMALVDDTFRINYEFCSTCTQCIAICPQQALSWNHVPPVAYDNPRLPSLGQLDELFKQRRSIRFYKKDKIDRTLLEEIIGYGVYAPTHNFELRAIVVDDDNFIDELDRIVLMFVSRIYNLIYRPKIVYNLVRRISSTSELVMAKPKMESALESGHSFHQPAAIIFIVGDRRIPLSEPSAQYALYNMILYAQAKGIGSCLWGNAQLFLNRNKAARKHLGLRKNENIFGALGLGYPAIKFANKVEGKTLNIHWNKG